MTTAPEVPELQWWEPCDWLVAFGRVAPAAFLQEARRQLLLPDDLDLTDEEILLETLHVRQLDTTDEGDPVWTPCAAEATGARTVTVWRS